MDEGNFYSSLSLQRRGAKGKIARLVNKKSAPFFRSALVFLQNSYLKQDVGEF